MKPKVVPHWLFEVAGAWWNFIDRRDIDKHIAAWWSFYVTWYLIDWTLEYAFKHYDKPGLELAAIISAILLPWTPVQAAIVRWYFEARS